MKTLEVGLKTGNSFSFTAKNSVNRGGCMVFTNDKGLAVFKCPADMILYVMNKKLVEKIV